MKLWDISIHHTVKDGKNTYDMKISEQTAISSVAVFRTADLINLCDYIYAMLELYDA